jgi:hypothetical protein
VTITSISTAPGTTVTETSVEQTTKFSTTTCTEETTEYLTETKTLPASTYTSTTVEQVTETEISTQTLPGKPLISERALERFHKASSMFHASIC